MGLLTIGYIVNRFTEALIQGYFQEGIRMRQEQQAIAALDRHYIVCGFGRTGRYVAKEFAAEGIPFVIIDDDLEEVVEDCMKGGGKGAVFFNDERAMDKIDSIYVIGPSTIPVICVSKATGLDLIDKLDESFKFFWRRNFF